MKFKVVSDRSKSNVGKPINYARVSQQPNGVINVRGYLSGREHAYDFIWPIEAEAKDDEAMATIEAMDVAAGRAAAERVLKEREKGRQAVMASREHYLKLSEARRELDAVKARAIKVLEGVVYDDKRHDAIEYLKQYNAANDKVEYLEANRPKL